MTDVENNVEVTGVDSFGGSLPQIDVLIVVDVLNAVVSSKGLMDNTYMVDTNKFMGSYGEGTNKLATKCYDNQIINWRVVGISPNTSIEIEKFTGSMLDNKVCVPKKQGSGNDIYWRGTVQTQGAATTASYYIYFSINGKSYYFDPIIQVLGEKK